MKEMIRRHWIVEARNIDELERQVLSFLEITTPEQEPKFQPHAARASVPFNAAQRAWLFRARALARATPLTAKFSDTRLAEALTKLKALCHTPQEARHVPRILADAGIRFLVVEHLPKTRIDGVCLWLDERSPVVVLSIRYDRIDSFWHTLMHELMHVKERHGLNEQPHLDIDVLQQTDEREQTINSAAADTLIRRAELENFMARVGPLYSKEKIRGFASRVGVHPGIVAGQLHHRIKMWAHSREMLVPVRQYVVGSAVTDGWGHVAATRV